MNETATGFDLDLEVEEMFVRNMRLLKFPQSKLATKKKIVLRNEMFRQPNKVGFEVTMYFLFQKLNPEKCEKDFRTCWEIFDQKQASQFRRVCAQWIEEIEIDRRIDLPRKAGPILVSPYGRKFYWLIFNLSLHVLHKLTSKELTDPTTDPATLRIRTRFHSENYKIGVEEHKVWMKKYEEIVKYNVDMIKELKLEIADLKTNLGKLRKNSSQWIKAQNNEEVMIKLNRRWNFVHQMTRDQQTFEMFPALLSDNQTHVLDCKKLKVNIPDLLLQRADEAGLDQEDLDQLYDKDKNVNLNSLVQICNGSLKLQLTALKQSSLEKVGGSVKHIEKSVKKHDILLEDMRLFLAKLLSSKDELDMLVKQASDSAQVLPLTHQKFKDYILPSTPPYNFNAAQSSISFDLKTPKLASLYAVGRHEDLKRFGVTPTLLVEGIPVDNQSLNFSPIGGIRRQISRVETPPSTYVPWFKRASASNSNQSTPKELAPISSRETSAEKVNSFRSSTPHHPYFNLSQVFERSVEENVEGSTFNRYLENGSEQETEKKSQSNRGFTLDISEILIDSIAESTKQESLGIVECLTMSDNDSHWL